MSNRVTKRTPVLRVGEYESSSGGAYIYFDEELGIPDFDSSGIRFELAADSSFENAEKIVAILKENGFQFVVQN